MRTRTLFACMVCLGILATSAVSNAQGLFASLTFDELEEQADEVVEVTLDKAMLGLASKFMAAEDEDPAVRDMVEGMSGIYVRSYAFGGDDEYDKSVVERARKLIPKDWQKIISVRSKRSENVEIFARTVDDAIEGLVIIAAEPHEFTIVSLEGRIDIDKLAQIEGQFGIPDLELENAEAAAEESTS